MNLSDNELLANKLETCHFVVFDSCIQGARIRNIYGLFRPKEWY